MTSAPHSAERPGAAPSSGGGPFTEPAPASLALPTDEIHVFRLELDLPPEVIARLGGLLSEEEAAQAARFHFARDRVRFTARRAQLRTLVARYVGGAGADVRFASGPHGKPLLEGPHGAPRFQLSVARSDRLAVVAVTSDDELGVDLERVRTLPDALPVARRFFSEEERRHLESLAPHRLDAAFFSYWTRKEAMVKSMGLGLHQPLDSFTLSVPGSLVPERVVVEGSDRTSRLTSRWLLPVPSPDTSFLAALATAGAPRPVRCFAWPTPA